MASQTRFRGFNVNLGVLWKTGPRFRLGAVYKTPFTMHYDDLQTTTSESVMEAQIYDSAGRVSVASAARQQTIETVLQLGRVRWPRTLGVGVAFNPRPELTVSSDITTSDWSGAIWTRTTTRRSMSVRAAPPLFETSFSGSVRWPTSLPLKDSPDLEQFRVSLRDQRDTLQARLGAEYVLTRRKLVVPLRAGAFVDRQYFTDGRGGGVRAWGWTAGAGVVWSRLAFDIAYVRQSTGYSLDFDFITEDDGGRVDEQRALYQDHIGANRIYVSGIVRF